VCFLLHAAVAAKRAQTVRVDHSGRVRKQVHGASRARGDLDDDEEEEEEAVAAQPCRCDAASRRWLSKLMSRLMLMLGSELVP
jgi:hypothetical protein